MKDGQLMVIILSIYFALIMGGYGYTYIAEQNADRERMRMEQRIAERYKRIETSLDRIEELLYKRGQK